MTAITITRITMTALWTFSGLNSLNCTYLKVWCIFQLNSTNKQNKMVEQTHIEDLQCEAGFAMPIRYYLI